MIVLRGSIRASSRGNGSRRKKKRKKRQTGAQMLAEYEKKQREKEEKRLAKEKEEADNLNREIRENFEELETNHKKHISFYGLFRKFSVKRTRCNTMVENPTFLVTFAIKGMKVNLMRRKIYMKSLM